MAISVADPGFPVGGGADPLGGHQPPTHTLFGEMYAKTKEIDPVGGCACRRRPPPPLDPPMYIVSTLARWEGNLRQSDVTKLFLPLKMPYSDDGHIPTGTLYESHF